VSNVDPFVVRSSVPVAGGSKRYQIDAPPGSPATAGSPGCFVAVMFPPATVPSTASTIEADVRASLGIGA
jgi:hypothetical protein